MSSKIFSKFQQFQRNLDSDFIEHDILLVKRKAGSIPKRQKWKNLVKKLFWHDTHTGKKGNYHAIHESLRNPLASVKAI